MNETVVIAILLLVGVFLFQYFMNEKNEEEEIFRLEKERKEALAELIEKRETRIDKTETSEEEFWKLIERIQLRSSTNYKNCLGLFKDFIQDYSPEKLIQLDNLIIRLLEESISQDIHAASTIIFKTSDIQAANLLLNLCISQGQSFFNNASHNPNVLVNKDFQDIIDADYSMVVGEVYFEKTDAFIPLPIENKDFKIPGEPWNEKDLPTKYKELWMAFA